MRRLKRRILTSSLVARNAATLCSSTPLQWDLYLHSPVQSKPHPLRLDSLGLLPLCGHRLRCSPQKPADRMDNGTPTIGGEIPSGATMRPRYMGRTMNTYPVSEPEMENISSLSAQTTARFSASTFLFALAASIWTNSIFYTELTPEAHLAAHYVAPLLLVFSVSFAVAACHSMRKRSSAWEKIKQDSEPIQAVSAPATMIAPQPRP
jgi:hypothetical protein